jgi:hypothetical protein
LADRLEQLISRERETGVRAYQPAACIKRGIFELDLGDVAVHADGAHRPRPVLDFDAVDLREFLLVMGRSHLVGATAIDDGDVFGAEPLRLHRDIDRRIAPADHHHAPADRQMRFLLRPGATPQCRPPRR